MLKHRLNRKKDVLIIIIRNGLSVSYDCDSKKRRIPIYLTKTALKATSNAIFNMKKVDVDES